MDYKIAKHTDRPYYQIEISGRFDVPDLENCYMEIINYPGWAPGMDILWDARECTFEHLTNDDLSSIGDMTAKYQELRGKGLAAWVVQRDVDFGISRMFEMLTEGKVIFNFKVFKTMDAAKNFLSDFNREKAGR
ncbi:MAG: hypothetical protein KKE17_02360 [Proteobacteria bacterium]|nr:hypothetical protein [Pseudomonadota bacterium]MBU1708824.1 hypothetical protein [Pseudomonadota bacterium]